MRKKQAPRGNGCTRNGQGYDMVERPLVRHDETMTIAKKHETWCPPDYVTATTYSWCCDNFLIGEDRRRGAAHKFRRDFRNWDDSCHPER